MATYGLEIYIETGPICLWLISKQQKPISKQMKPIFEAIKFDSDRIGTTLVEIAGFTSEFSTANEWNRYSMPIKLRRFANT